MLIKRCAAVLAFALYVSSAQADVIWVGSSPQCTGLSTVSTITQALQVAELLPGPDEVRLTRTLTYSGATSTIDLLDWDPATKGALTISGGYSNCFTTQSGRTSIENASATVFQVRTFFQARSEVTFDSLIFSDVSDRVIEISGGADVIVRNTIIEESRAGISVTSGANLEFEADSIIRDSGELIGVGFVRNGGGISCTGNNSTVALRGDLFFNAVGLTTDAGGGNVYVASGCEVEAFGGALIEAGRGSNRGGGVYVAAGGVFIASGGQSRVGIVANIASEGGGLYVEDSGEAFLVNTVFRNNFADRGAAIFAINGGSSTTQLFMDRAQDCPFIISCSEIEGSTISGLETGAAAVYVENSAVAIQRTLFDRNDLSGSETIGIENSAIRLVDSIAYLSRIGFIANSSYALIASESSEAIVRHVTAVRNGLPGATFVGSYAMALRNSDTAVYNSIFSDTQGFDQSPGASFTATCNLVDNSSFWPMGTFDLGDAVFVNAPGGDLRQRPESPGVDMCNEQPDAPALDRDFEFQPVPVNEFTNPQGNPGQAGGLHDAGVDEVYSNIGDDKFLLTVNRAGYGAGLVTSSPSGINCGSSCSAFFFQGETVTLTASASGGSAFTGWSNCPSPSGNQCVVQTNMDRTVTATFEVNEFELTVERSGPGTGQVTSAPAGIDCGSDCSETYSADTTVVLTAIPDPDNAFISWLACPAPNGRQCSVLMNSDRTVTARFTNEDVIFADRFQD